MALSWASRPKSGVSSQVTFPGTPVQIPLSWAQVGLPCTLRLSLCSCPWTRWTLSVSLLLPRHGWHSPPAAGAWSHRRVAAETARAAARDERQQGKPGHATRGTLQSEEKKRCTLQKKIKSVPLWNSDGQIQTSSVCVSTSRVLSHRVCRAQATVNRWATREGRERRIVSSETKPWGNLQAEEWLYLSCDSVATPGPRVAGVCFDKQDYKSALVTSPLHPSKNSPSVSSSNPGSLRLRRRGVSQLRMTSLEKLPLTP